MATAPPDTLLRHLRQLAAGPGGAPWTDRQLTWALSSGMMKELPPITVRGLLMEQ